jgi:hypothetical protein
VISLNFSPFTLTAFFLPNDRNPMPPIKISKGLRPNDYF